MSRVGKNPIKIPSSVSVVQDGLLLTFNGKLGHDSYKVPEGFEIERSDSDITIVPIVDSIKGKKGIKKPTNSTTKGLIEEKKNPEEEKKSLEEERLNTKKNIAKNITKDMKILWGTTQRNISNIVHGITEGFVVNLDLIGVGYKASVSGNSSLSSTDSVARIVMQLGMSHDVIVNVPSGIEVKCPKPTSISLKSISKQRVGQFAAEIRSWRPPEPYKGKGIIREGEYVVRKEGKKK